MKPNKITVALPVIAGSFFAATWDFPDIPTVAPKQEQFARSSTDPPVPARGKMGQDLFLAIDHRDTNAVKNLLKQGADPNSRNGLEFTPLFIAAASYQPDVVKALLESGAKVDASSPYGTALTFASISGNLMAAKELISRGADVNVFRRDGMTPLMMAANAGNPELISELLNNKAKVDTKDDSGRTALSFAARAGHLEVGRRLIAAGTNLENTDTDGNTALMDAAMTGRTEFVKLLLENKANVNATDNAGRTPLMLAASYGDFPEVMKALIDAGANLKAADNSGRTPAAMATARGYAKTAALLGKPSAAELAKVGKTPNARQAVASSLQALQRSMVDFTANAKCISCHHEGLGRMATAEAKNHGIQIDMKVAQTLQGRTVGAIGFMEGMNKQALVDPEAMKQLPLIEINEVSTGTGWFMAGMAASHDPANSATAAMAEVLGRQQNKNGYWGFSLPRAPMQSSPFTYTALAIRALTTYGGKENSKTNAERIAKAKEWMLKTPAKSSDDLAFRLLGLKWAGASSAELKLAAKELLAAQLGDGGWAQMANMPADAYATGQALYALSVSGQLPTKDPAFQKGIGYLVRTQDEDGSWFVNKRAIPANNYFHAGFAHGESEFSSFNGTSWALMALLQTVAGN
jgi:ankyrin repeat protein